MLQLNSISNTIKSCPVPNQCFIIPKFIPLRRYSVSTSAPTSTFSLTRSPLSVKCRQTELFDTTSFPSPPQRPQSPQRPQPPVGALPPRVYVGHTVYKGKAVLTVTPRPPEFTSLESGAFKVSKEGYVLLQFAPAVGTRQYDWNRKQVFSLSVDEMGTLISLGARESFEFFHDPLKGKSDEGKVRKVLKVEPLPDGSGHLFNLSVQNKSENIDESIFIPITRAELAVFNSIFTYIMPYLLGWHAFANSIKPEVYNRANNANSRYAGDYEWNG